MKSFFGDKVWVILLVVVALLALVILAAGLGEMEFGQPFNIKMDRSSAFDFSSLEAGKGVRWFQYLIPGLLVILYLLMLSPARPRPGGGIFNALLRSFAFLMFFMIVLGAFARQGGFFTQNVLDGLPVPGAGGEGLDEFAPPTLTSGSVLAITLALIAVSAVFVVIIINRMFDRFYKPKADMSEIAGIAREALHGLGNPVASKNAIIRCYFEMSRAVQEKQGVVREEAATPAEFAARLGALGLPRGAVHGLTGVFEQVRYGRKQADAREIEEAKQCLTEIIKACETKR